MIVKCPWLCDYFFNFFFFTSEYEFGLFLIISEYCSSRGSSPKMHFIYFGYLFKMMDFEMIQIV